MMRTEFNERTWLAWLSKVRIIVITFLLAIELVIARLTVTSVPVRGFISVIAVWYTISLFYVLLLPLWREDKLQAKLQVLTDMAFANVIIYVTGGIDTSFNFLNPLIVIMASILLSRTWAFLSAVLSFIFFGAILELSYFEAIHSYTATRPDQRSLQLVLFVNLFAYLAVAYLASNLAAKLRQVDVELKDKSGALQNLQALHKHVIDSISSGLITTGLDGRITLLNPAGEKLLETSVNNVFGRPVSQLFLDRLPPIGAPRGEVRSLTPGGHEKTFGIAASALTVPDGGFIGYVYAFADLTEVRRLEREVRMRDRLAAIGRMAGGIAHEIRNPLASIAGSVQVFSGISQLTQEQQSLLDIVLRESERLNAIISDFLLYARDKTYKMAVVDLVPLLDETLAGLDRAQHGEPRVTLERRYQADSAWVLADRERMRQVFANLCRLSLGDTRGGGRLTASLAPAGDHWRLSFSGSGAALSTQQIEKIFEPFQPDLDGGTGLGMAIVYQTLQAHDARVLVHSSPGKGIEFVIELKRSQPPSQLQPRAVPAAAETTGVMHG